MRVEASVMRKGKAERMRLPFKGLSIPVNEWALYQLWAAINELDAKLSPPSRFRVSVWGTKRAQPGGSLYESVLAMSNHFAQNGIAVVTGGGPGVMRAANEGAQAGKKGKVGSFALRVRITNEPANEFSDRVFHHHTFHTRLHNFIRLSSAFVVMDPGVGTVLEMLLVWQLLKEKHLVDVPLVLVGAKWGGLLDWMDTGMVQNGHRRSKEIPSLHHVSTTEQAIEIVMEAHERFKARQAAI